MTIVKPNGARGSQSRKKRVVGTGLVIFLVLVLTVAYSALVFTTFSKFQEKQSRAVNNVQQIGQSIAASAKEAQRESKPQISRRSVPASPPNTVVSSASQNLQHDPPSPPWKSSRFPRFGSGEFADLCNWTAAPVVNSTPLSECTFRLRPNPKSNEGLAWWTGAVVSGYVASLQSGCRFFVDYGPGVDVTGVMVPQLAMDGFPLVNWTVPDGFGNCTRRQKCYDVSDNYSKKHLAGMTKFLGHMRGHPTLPIPAPKYRFMYSPKAGGVDMEELRELEQNLPGFVLDSGMACVHHRLLRLAPTASDFVPDLFTKILPTVTDEEALVIALYIRTGLTDRAAKAEASGEEFKGDTAKIGGRTLPQRVIDDAVKVEGVKLAARQGRSSARQYSRVVWMLITDSPKLKKLTVEAYDGKLAMSASNCTSDGQTISVPRTVVVTTSRGTQTKPKRGPSTADFAEAIIDWYLIGESDLVISAGGISFGSTGALRAARPLYKGTEGCNINVVDLPDPQKTKQLINV